MHVSTFSSSEIRTMTLMEAIARVEQAWGVKVSVSVAREESRLGGHALNLIIDVYEQVHRSELSDPPAGMLPAMDTRLIPLETQMVSAIAGYCLMLDEHMRNSTRP